MAKKMARLECLTRCLAMAAALLLSGTASADWLFWTVDFTYNWGNAGELQDMPGKAGENYNVWLVAVNGDNKTVISDKIALTDGWTGCLTQTDLSMYDSGYTFYVEMGAQSSQDWVGCYKSPDVSYSDLEPHTVESLRALMTPWNAAVGGPWTVPEPSGGLLMLVGFALLMLRRQKTAAI